MIQNGTSQSPFCNQSSTTYYLISAKPQLEASMPLFSLELSMGAQITPPLSYVIDL
jgi:hypothetical protein